MDYAVVVYFDKDVDMSVSQLMKKVCLSGVNPYMLDADIRPHITFAIFKDTNPNGFSAWLKKYAHNIDRFDIKFSSIGVFPADLSVLFLAPVVEESLIKLHRTFNKQAEKIASGFEKYYLPGNWVPHCSLAVRLNRNELHNAVDAAVSEFKPFNATVTQIGFVQCNPFKEITTFEIGKR